LSNPHDKFFKEALTQPGATADFLRYYLPAEVAALLDLTAFCLICPTRSSRSCRTTATGCVICRRTAMRS
jgi:predicted transposase YdaD